MERLDRCLGTKDWINLFPNFLVRHLDFWKSDHWSLILEFSYRYGKIRRENRKAGKTFFFEECWGDDKECRRTVEETWNINLGRCAGQIQGVRRKTRVLEPQKACRYA
ncbi:hypothetical protein Ddye_008747 [Dipteronia dyeriana]|uniref:Uncharacterized protein n=1 Tax=Dipteronia dyeriana TaxID=168575 RepID=A0AAD9XA30_9ROSI|nr:hypothetical protein Ddye_008747 [Dipteronia dyeriana]